MARTAAQKRKDNIVAELGCIVCLLELGEYSPALVHHLLEGTGLSQRDHDRRIPLCFNHHSADGDDGIHGGQKSWEAVHGTEEELLEIVEGLI